MKKQLFYDRMKTLLSEDFDEFVEALETNLNKGIRLNKLKLDKEEFERLMPFSFEQVPWCNEGYYLENSEDRPSKHPYYYAGLYYLQEPSAMIPVEALDVKPGDRVLDISAAPGGKSTQISSKLMGKGIIISNDINPKRTIALNKNISLFGVRNSVVINNRPENLKNIFPGFFNKILVDAPCSGEGLIKKNINNFEIDHEKYVAMQKQILSSVHEMLEDGGELVYSTCTFNPSENEGIINWFLDTFKEYDVADINIDGLDSGRPEWINGHISIAKTRRAWPHKIRGEGHFIAKLVKKSGVINKKYQSFLMNKNNLESYFYFVKEYGLDESFDSNVSNINNFVYQIPIGLPNMKNIKPLSTGVLLGEIKRDKFIPSQEMSLLLNKNNFSNIIDINGDDIRIIKYLKGETIEVDEKIDGLSLVCVDGYGLGFGKSQSGMLKNLYKRQWRML